jgi:hypothetical protein
LGIHRTVSLSVAAVFVLAACTTKPPPIARGLPSNMQEARQAFSERVPMRFPVGSAETDLRAELQRQHFTIRTAGANRAPYQFSAIVDIPGFCRQTWVILWGAQTNQITSIAGDFSQTCL